MEIRERIKRKRELANLSQKELADMVGLTDTSISNIERGKSCTLSSLEKICKALNMRVSIEILDEGLDDLVCFSSDELQRDIRKCFKQLNNIRTTLAKLID